MSGHKVSVIIPTFNRAFSLNRCIDSALNQSYKDVEVIVVDDGSTDNSLAVMQEYLKDSRVRYIRHDMNKGAQAARNTGIRSATGDYIAFLDSDDEWLPKKLEIQLDKARQSKSFCVIHGDALVVNEGTGETKRFNVPKLEGYVFKALLASHGPLMLCIFAPKHCFEQIGYLDESVPSMQEWDTAIALSKYYEFLYCEDPLAVYYLSDNDTISKDKKRLAAGLGYIVNKYRREIITYVGSNVLSMHYLKIYELCVEADDARNARAFLIRSLFAHPNRSNVSDLIDLFLGKKIALIAAKIYRLFRRNTKRRIH